MDWPRLAYGYGRENTSNRGNAMFSSNPLTLYIGELLAAVGAFGYKRTNNAVAQLVLLDRP